MASTLAASLIRQAQPGREEDDILLSKGSDIYDRMMCDSQVRGCIEIKSVPAPYLLLIPYQERSVLSW